MTVSPTATWNEQYRRTAGENSGQGQWRRTRAMLSASKVDLGTFAISRRGRSRSSRSSEQQPHQPHQRQGSNAQSVPTPSG